MNVAQALQQARTLGVGRLDAMLLLAHHLQQTRAWLLAHDEAELPAAPAAAFQHDLLRRADDVPLAYLTGRREFHGLMLEVTPAVLVPRPETEALVDWAVDLLQARRAQWPCPQVADLGTGSGAIALAVKARCPWARVLATDLSEAALAVARANAGRLGLELDFAQGSWFAALQGRRFELLLSNPPYVACDDPHLPALRHEPRAALAPADDDGTGLPALRQLAAGATAHLSEGAWLLVEHGHDQAEAVASLFAAAGLRQINLRRDLAGMPRHTGARFEGSAGPAR